MHIAFYQCIIPIEKVLVRLLEKAYANQQRTMVVCESEEQKGYLNTFLWTYSTKEFLPHGTAEDISETHRIQPIWLTTGLDHPNQSTLLISMAQRIDPIPQGIEKMMDIFSELTAPYAEERRKFYLGKNYEISVWNQAKNQEGYQWKQLDTI